MKPARLLIAAIALLALPACFKFGPRLEESSRLVMGPLDEGTILQKTQQTTIRIGDREQVSSVLVNVFGPAAQKAVTENVLRKPALFGGPCDIHSESAQSEPNCTFEDVSAGPVPVVTSAREALRTQTCDRIVQDDAAIRYAAAQARDLDDGSFIDSEAPGDADIQAAFELFVPGRTLPADALEALKTGVVAGAQKQSGKTAEGWRFLFLTLCLSPQWEIL